MSAMIVATHELELLAPARDADIGIEAVNHGADAVYIGGPGFGARDKALPGVHAGLWAQYALDSAASVPEALDILALRRPYRHSGP